MKYVDFYESPLGSLVLESDGEYLIGLSFEGFDNIRNRPNNRLCEDLEVFRETKRWLDIYFAGNCPDFMPKFRIEGATSFRKEVLELLIGIPYGEVESYGNLAKVIAERRGIERMSAQAVGGAVGWNPIPIIIPCHRVVGAKGHLTGFSCGMEKKVALLKLEGHDMNEFIE